MFWPGRAMPGSGAWQGGHCPSALQSTLLPLLPDMYLKNKTRTISKAETLWMLSYLKRKIKISAAAEWQTWNNTPKTNSWKEICASSTWIKISVYNGTGGEAIQNLSIFNHLCMFLWEGKWQISFPVEDSLVCCDWWVSIFSLVSSRCIVV